MRKINLSDFLNFAAHLIAEKIGFETNVDLLPALRDNALNKNSLLFLTENTDGTTASFNIDGLTEQPYAIVANIRCGIDFKSLRVIKVKNVREAFAYANCLLYDIDCKKLKLIGVTGTNGKTTTASLIYQMLLLAGYHVGYIGTGKIAIDNEILSPANYSMTTPDPTVLYKMLSIMQEICDYTVIEVSSHSLALGKVAPLRFSYSIFTNLSSEHLDFHKDMESYYKCKLRLFDQSDVGLFNLDDKYSKKAFKESRVKKRTVGIIENAEAFATDIVVNESTGISFFFRENNIMFKANAKLYGTFNVYNILMALKCVIDLGMKPCIAKEALSSISGIAGRMEMLDERFKIIIDYAHTPEAMHNCLKYLFSTKNARQKLIVVFGCGGNRDRSKRKKMAEAASKFADRLIITEDNNRNESFNNIVSDIVMGVSSPDYRIICDRECAIRTAIQDANDGDYIAIIGKGHEKYIIKNGITYEFDEKEIIYDELKKAKNYAN